MSPVYVRVTFMTSEKSEATNGRLRDQVRSEPKEIGIVSIVWLYDHLWPTVISSVQTLQWSRPNLFIPTTSMPSSPFKNTTRLTLDIWNPTKKTKKNMVVRSSREICRFKMLNKVPVWCPRVEWWQPPQSPELWGLSNGQISPRPLHGRPGRFASVQRWQTKCTRLHLAPPINRDMEMADLPRDRQKNFRASETRRVLV